MPTETRLIYYTSPSRLQVLASLKMALLLWRHKFAEQSSSDGLPSMWFYTKELILVPTSIEKQIDSYIPPMGKELKQWIDYHSERIFFDSELAWTILRCFDHIVLYQNGAMNYVATAKKLLQCYELNDVEKFRLACLYCIEEEVKTLWPSVHWGQTKGLHNSLIRPLVHYWNNRLNKERHCKHVCYKRIFASYSKCARNWTALMHFLNYFEMADQITQVIDLIDQDPTASLNILPKLTIDQQRQVIMKQGAAIWSYLSKKTNYGPYAVRLWCFFGQFATVHQLLAIIKLAIDDTEFGFRVRSDENQRMGRLLYEVWKISQYNLKHYIAYNNADRILSVLHDNEVLRITCRDVRFLIEVLEATSQEFRAEFWKTHWCKVIFNVPPKYLEKVIRMCVDDTVEIDRIKTRLSQDVEYLKKYCKFSFQEGYYEDVNDLFDFCRVDPIVMRELKKDLLDSIRLNARPILKLNDPDRWLTLNQFIDQHYVQYAEQATNFKKDMMSSVVMQDALNELLLDGEFYNVRRFVDLFLLSHDSVNLKKDLIDSCGKYLENGITYNFNEANWNEFLTWCFNDKQNKINEFKFTLKVDEIFDEMLRKCIEILSNRSRKKNHDRDFFKLNNFLKWYYITWSAVRDYKMKKIDGYGSIDDIKSTFKIENNDVLASILNWFYDGDREKIHRRKHSATNLSPLASKVDNWKHKIFKHN